MSQPDTAGLFFSQSFDELIVKDIVELGGECPDIPILTVEKCTSGVSP